MSAPLLGQRVQNQGGGQTHWAVSGRPVGGHRGSEGTTHPLSLSPGGRLHVPLATQPSLLSRLGRERKLTAEPWAQVK